MQGGPMTADDADAMVRVTYIFAPWFAALEPSLLVGVFTALFMIWVAASRLDLTIVKGREWQAQQVCPLTHCSVSCSFSYLVFRNSLILFETFWNWSGPIRGACRHKLKHMMCCEKLGL